MSNTINKSAPCIDYYITFFYSDTFHIIIKPSFIHSGSFIHWFHKAKQTEDMIIAEKVPEKQSTKKFVQFHKVLHKLLIFSFLYLKSICAIMVRKKKTFFGMFLFNNAQ